MDEICRLPLTVTSPTIGDLPPHLATNSTEDVSMLLKQILTPDYAITIKPKHGQQRRIHNFLATFIKFADKNVFCTVH